MRARQIKFFQNDRKTKGNDPTHILMDDPLMHLLLLQQPKITEQGQTNPIQFNSIQQQVIMPSEDQLKEWKELYECFDKDKDGNDKGTLAGGKKAVRPVHSLIGKSLFDWSKFSLISFCFLPKRLHGTQGLLGRSPNAWFQPQRERLGGLFQGGTFRRVCACA